MQSEPTGASHQVAALQPSDPIPSVQDGSSSNVPTSPPLPDREERGPILESESEWSLSSHGGDSTNPALDPAWLRHLSCTAASAETLATVRNQYPSIFDPTGNSIQAPLQRCPEEILLHMFTFLNAKDLLNMHLVCRRFHNLVMSPYAWIGAFSRHFPGPDRVKASRLRVRESQKDAVVRTEDRVFTRLSSKPSWATEYLVRTKLLRCLEKGRPALPFASASPGKANRGFATLTFSSTLPTTITHLCANFGSVLDKRLPNFMHGNSRNGIVARSDKRGKIDAWGMTANNFYRQFESLYPGVPMWGLGAGPAIGVPNLMDLSSEYGAIMAECVPDGDVWYLSGKPNTFCNVLYDRDEVNFGIPQIPYTIQTSCSVWIAKTSAIPKASGGLIGMLSGSSTGIVTAGCIDQAHDRGGLTARWILCPGVPIIHLAADDQYSEARRQENRIWLVAVNALGEVFYLDKMPELKRPFLRPGVTTDVACFENGASFVWSLVESSRRAKKQSAVDYNLSDCYPVAANPKRGEDQRALFSSEQLADTTTWLSRTPAEIQYFFDGWDMRRRVVVDFSGDGSGCPKENIVVIGPGDEPCPCPSIVRYTRAHGKDTQSSPNNAVLSVAWHTSELDFGLPSPTDFKLTTLAMDTSRLAMLTQLEDEVSASQSSKAARHASKQDINRGPDLSKSVPGGRARFVAVGTSDGVVYLWNVRALTSPSMTMHITPIRVIKTPSYEITSLALNGLLVVHGGAEGLVQAWDPLASTMQPIRTISSRSTLNARRRAALVAQQNQDPNTWTRTDVAASAICLDPDPTVLRGVAAIGSYLRYWSYDSSGATEALSHSQRRKMSARKTSSSVGGEGSIISRRIGVKNLVEDELLWREQDLKEDRAQEKQRRRVAKKYGADILGEDATEEELIAYAKLLSQEHSEREQLRSEEARALQGATPDEIEKYVKTASPEAFQHWQFASWEDRFSMLGLKPGDVHTDSAVEAPINNEDFGDEDLRKAIELSLRTETQPTSLRSQSEDEQFAQAASLSLGEFTSIPESSKKHQLEYQALAKSDEDMARALSLSLQERPGGSPVESSSDQTYAQHEEDDLAKAIRLSLQEQQPSVSRSTSSSTETGEVNATDSDFPALTSPLHSSLGSSRSKGKRRAR